MFTKYCSISFERYLNNGTHTHTNNSKHKLLQFNNHNFPMHFHAEKHWNQSKITQLSSTMEPAWRKHRTSLLSQKPVYYSMCNNTWSKAEDMKHSSARLAIVIINSSECLKSTIAWKSQQKNYFFTISCLFQGRQNPLNSTAVQKRKFNF